MTAEDRLTHAAINAITEDVMASIADILFAAKVLHANPESGALEPPKEIANAIRNIEITLHGLNDFIPR